MWPCKMLQTIRRLISPDIQKDIVCIATTETRNAIVNDLGSEYCHLVDESRDASHKEKIAVILRYVDKHNHVIESFPEILHVNDTSATP